jgi:hypothetical protein
LKLKTGEWVVLGGSLLIAAFAALVGVLIYLKPPPSEFKYAQTEQSREWLLDYLKNPRAGVGDKPYRLRMPSYAHLPPAELAALTEYLAALRLAD